MAGRCRRLSALGHGFGDVFQRGGEVFGRAAFGVRGACSRFQNLPLLNDSASKLDALQTLRATGMPGFLNVTVFAPAPTQRMFMLLTDWGALAVLHS